MNNEKSIRAFLAVDPPQEVLNEIAGIQDRLKKAVRGDIRWVRSGSIHLTLKFFGDISESDSANISRVIKSNLVNIKPFTLNTRRVGAFPDVKRPRVLWLGMDGDTDILISLQRAIDGGLQDCGFKKEDRPFRPHLTLARIKEPKGLIGLAKVIEKSKDDTAGSFIVDGLNLFKSDLTPQGAVYTKLAYFQFAGF